MPDLKQMLADLIQPAIHQQTSLLENLTNVRRLLMASKDTINQALDQLQGTIDLTQENVQALLDLIRSNPDQATLDQIEQRLISMNSDLQGTSFDTTIQPVGGSSDTSGSSGSTPAQGNQGGAGQTNQGLPAGTDVSGGSGLTTGG